jgi:hypothetical protein
VFSLVDILLEVSTETNGLFHLEPAKNIIRKKKRKRKERSSRAYPSLNTKGWGTFWLEKYAERTKGERRGDKRKSTYLPGPLGEC